MSNWREALLAHARAASLAGALAACSAAAVDRGQDPQRELQARELHLAQHLRCVVCQNQTVAESNAPLAADMRRQIREQLQAGHSDEAVVDFFEQRYGAFVRYRPPLTPATWVLWGAPFALLLLGVGLLLRRLSRQREADRPALPPAERERARALLAGEEPLP